MKRAVAWDLPTFTRFYGRVVPTNSDSQERFSRFSTSSRNDDIEELDVEFDKSLEPMTFMSLMMCSRELYVLGEGNTYSDWDGHTYFSNYTLFNREGLEKYLEQNASSNTGRIMRELDSAYQAVIDMND